MRSTFGVRISKPALAVIVSLLICFGGALLSSLAETDFGSVEKETLTIESATGHRLSIDLLKPKSATTDDPAPAIVFAHGGNANKEKSQGYQIEWARRGFVVASLDLYGHGESEVMDDVEWLEGGRGTYDTVRYMSTVPFVDASRIAVSGHSRGGNTIHESILIDNEQEEPLINAVLYVSRDAVYREGETASFGYVPGKTNVVEAAKQGDGDEFFNYYGNRTVGIIAGAHDDFSFKEKDPETGGMKPNPEFLSSDKARSFLNFGATPTAGTPDGISGQWYFENIDGKEAGRVIYLVDGIHNTVLFRSVPTTDAVEFMEVAQNHASDIPASSHIYQWRIVGGLVGLAGFFLFIPAITLWLVRLPLFAKAGSTQDAVMRVARKDSKARLWLWICVGSTTVFSVLSALVLFQLKVDKHIGFFFMQGVPLFFAVWGSVNALFMLAVTVVWYRAFGRKHGVDLQEMDLAIGGGRLWSTIGLALTSSAAALTVIFAAKYFFNTDFRLLYWSARPFTADKIPEMLKLMPMFLLAYIAASVFINGLNYSTSFGRNKFGNITVLAFFNVLPPLLIALAGYGVFFATGVNSLWGTNTQISDTMMAPLLVLTVTPFIARAIYTRTRNPYLAGIINGIIVTVMTCVNSQISFPG